MKVTGIFLLAALLLVAPSCGVPELDTEVAEDESDPTGPAPVGGKGDVAASWPAAAPLPEACELARPLQVFFTPDDPAVTIELQMIDEIRARARAAAAQHPEGQNPYRIRYAVYNLTHDEIARRLADAEKDGVDVQVLVESDQLGHPWVAVDDIFRARGLEVVLDHTQLDQAGRVRADLIGIKAAGLMHLKTRLFEAPGFSAVLSGSLNPNGSAGANEENLHLIRDSRLVALYADAHTAVLESAPLSNTWDESQAVNLLFSPVGRGPRASTHLLRWLESEQEQILLMVFSLRNVTSPDHPRSLLDILKAKHAAGVPVHVITDRKQSDGVDLEGKPVASNDNLEDLLRQAGIPVWEAVNDAAAYYGSPYPFAAMHHKVAVLGRTRLRVITDASNWTAAALGSKKYPEKNVESQLFIDSDRLDGNATGKRYLAQWLRVLHRYAYQSQAIDQQPGADEIAARLLGAADWPGLPLELSARAQTSLGEEIYASGARDELGRWGELHGGVQLGTSAATYPIWRSLQPVELPLGARLEWKLTARSGNGVRWESGANRNDVAVPRVCGKGAAELQASWR